MVKPLVTAAEQTAHATARSNHPRLTRRKVVAGLASLAAGPLVGCGPGFPFPLLVGPFPLGVASGEASPSGAVLWTRYAGNARALDARVWQGTASEPTDETMVFLGPVVRGEGGAVRFEVEGLQPGERYSYRFEEVPEVGAPAESVQQSAVGRFRTAFAPEARMRLRVGATSCTKYSYPTATLQDAATRDDLDLFLWLGDASYNDAARTPGAYRDTWARTLVDPGQQAVRAAHALLSTWDDHEFTNNVTAESIDVARMEMAKAAFFEHVPMRQREDQRLWRSVRWGRTAEFFVLDCRGERRPSLSQYVSPEQLEWLVAGLRASPAAFKVVLSSVPIGEFPGAFFQATADDRWEGSPAQRERVLEAAASVPGVVFLAGDFHLASYGRVSRSGPGATLTEVLVGPGAQMSNPSPSYPSPPQFDWSSGINNYAVLDFDVPPPAPGQPPRARLTVEHVDGRGERLARHVLEHTLTA